MEEKITQDNVELAVITTAERRFVTRGAAHIQGLID